MYIIFGEDAYNKLRESYTLLEVDSKTLDEKIIPAYCVIPAGVIPVEEINELDSNKTLHETLIALYKKQDYASCKSLLPALMGKWGGEIDEFYQSLQQRLNNT